MTTKEYLGQANDILRKIKILQKEIDKMHNLVISPSIKMSGERVQSSGSYDPMADTITKIYEREKQLNSLIEKYLEKKSEIERHITMLDNGLYADVLYGRYVAGLTFYELSAVTGRKTRQTINIYSKALSAFENQFKRYYCDLQKENFEIFNNLY